MTPWRQAREPRILFRVAAGPRMGFGHLVRVARLARALNLVHPVVSVRGRGAPAAVVARLGLFPSSARFGTACARDAPTVVILDDPNAREARAVVARARRLGVRTVSLHDLGIAHAGADYGVDGSAAPGRAAPGRIESLIGLDYAVIDPRCAARPLLRRSSTVLIALGGGPRGGVALQLASAVAARAPDLRVVVALGFMARPPRRLSPGVTCVAAHEGLADLLREARVAVTAGGLTLTEAAACATPVLATAVVNAQRPTIRAFATQGAAIDGGRLTRTAIPTLADAVAALLDDAPRREEMGKAGRRLVDGRGTARVAAAVARWSATTSRGVR